MVGFFFSYTVVGLLYGALSWSIFLGLWTILRSRISGFSSTIPPTHITFWTGAIVIGLVPVLRMCFYVALHGVKGQGVMTTTLDATASILSLFLPLAYLIHTLGTKDRAVALFFCVSYAIATLTVLFMLFLFVPYTSAIFIAGLRGGKGDIHN